MTKNVGFCRKDEGWQLSRGVYIFLGFGLFLLLGAIAAVIATINPWMVGLHVKQKSCSFWISKIKSETLGFEFQVGAAFLLILLLLVSAISVIHYWASHNFYLTRAEMFLVCLAAFVLALAAFLVGLLASM